MCRPSIAVLMLCAVLSTAGQPCLATIQITSVNRGVSVDGIVSANSEMGEFNTSLYSDFGFGTATAEMESLINDSQFLLDGFAYETTESEGPLNSVEAAVFFEVTFTLDAPFTFSLGGILVGITETEHYYLRVSLMGPSVDLAYDVWNGFKILDDVGSLTPGNYIYSFLARPDVLGGLDGGQAEVYFENVVLSLVPGIKPGGHNLPEPGEMGAWALFCLCGSAIFVRRASSRVRLAQSRA